MEFRTPVDIPQPTFLIEPREPLLLVGSCFADNIGQRFLQEGFPAVVNPYGVMYNPVSVLHTVERFCRGEQPFTTGQEPLGGGTAGAGGTVFPRVVFITLGTNHVYRLRATGEIVDNCQKRPQHLFQEERLSVGDCVACLRQAAALLRERRPDVAVVFTVSPIRYRKYGYHESQLSKATLLLAVDELLSGAEAPALTYFPAYELVMDELRDYRFYAPDMLHPSAQAVNYIWEQLTVHYFSPRARKYLEEWAPLKAALGHRPFHPDSDAYRQFMADTQAKIAALAQRYTSPQNPLTAL